MRKAPGQHISPVKEKNTMFEDRIQALQNQLQERDTIIGSLKTELTAKSQQVAQVSSLQGQLSSMQNTNNSLQQQLSQKNTQLANLQQTIESMRVELSVNHGNAEATEELANLKEVHANQSLELEQIRQNAASPEVVQELKREVAQKNLLLDIFTQNIEELKNDKADLKNDKQYLQQQNIQMSSVVAKKDSELDGLKNLIQTRVGNQFNIDDLLTVQSEVIEQQLAGSFSVIEDEDIQ